MKILYTIILFFIFSSLLGQDKSNIILFDFKLEHLPESPRTLNTRIVDSKTIKDTFKIQIATYYSYCNNLTPKFKFRADTLFLGVSEGEEVCLLEYSNYHFYYSFAGVKKKYVIKWRGEEIKYSPEEFLTFPPEFKIDNGKRINYKDKYGLEQGHWKYFLNDERYFEGEYVDGRIMEGKFILYDKYENKIGEEFWKDNRPIRKLYFDSDGKITKECIMQDFNEIDCKDVIK